MKRLVFLCAAVVALSAALTMQAVADDNKTVNATVTPKVIAVTVSTTSLVYGTLAVGSSDNIPTPTNVTVTNSGNVEEDLKIKGATSTPGGWTLTSSTPGTDTHRHKWDPNSGGSFTASLTTSNQTLADDVAASGNTQAYFRLDMPSSTTSFVQQTLPIVITAFESTGPGPS